MTVIMGAIVDRLRAAATSAGDRVYVDRAIQGAAMPYIVITRTGTDRPRGTEAAMGVVFTVFDVDIFTATVQAREGLATEVRNRLDGFRGTFGNQTGAGVNEIVSLACSLLDEDSTVGESGDSGDKTHVFRMTQEYQLVHRETVPSFS